MKKFIGPALLVMGLLEPSRACDVCGSSASGQYLGVLPKASFNFVGVQYLFNSFSSEHPSLFEGRPNERSKDYYNTVQLWGRYAVGRRFQLYAFLPYRSNLQRTDTGSKAMSGIGDISLVANAVILNDDDADKLWQQQLLAGGGVKLPTGGYTGITERDKLGLPNMQPGSGSWDFLLNANYTLRRTNSGVNVDASYTMTMANTDRYKYGNRLNAGLVMFQAFTKGDYSLMPQLGYRYEFSLHDYDNYDRRWLNAQSGGYMSFATAGLQAYYRKLGARLTYQLPLSQHYARGYVTALNKIDAGVFLLF